MKSHKIPIVPDFAGFRRILTLFDNVAQIVVECAYKEKGYE